MDEILRETTLLLLRLTYALSQGQLESMDQELELLRSAPPLPPPNQTPTDDRKGKVKDEDDMWKLDTPVVSAASGPLLDPSGKVSQACLDCAHETNTFIAPAPIHYSTCGSLR